MKCSVNEIFLSIQGEGRFTGEPSIFVRFNGCNLRCAFAGGSICDTAYTSHDPEVPKYTDTEGVIEEIARLLSDNPCVRHIVFTGGEPMLQQPAMCEIAQVINSRFGNYGLTQKKTMMFTVETNGTKTPTRDTLDIITMFSISPKLENSCCFEGTNLSKSAQKLHLHNRFNRTALQELIVWGKGQFKFVYSGPETEEMITKFFDQVVEFSEYRKERLVENLDFDWDIMIMPEGQTLDQINKSSQAALPCCIKNGWRFCDRLHIRLWGDKRGV